MPWHDDLSLNIMRDASTLHRRISVEPLDSEPEGRELGSRCLEPSMLPKVESSGPMTPADYYALIR